MNNDIKLTQYSHGAGCGCKISPQVLHEILSSELTLPVNKQLLVGNDTKDDAAVYDLGNGTALVSTTDFFMPIVDDAFDFGRIASANAISDIYAMGGRPLMAIAILGWPVDKLPASVAQQVLEGSRSICKEAGIALAGGHSIDTQEPIFGLAVTGMLQVNELKQNSTAQVGDHLFLTKRLGVGILSTAQKRGVIQQPHLEEVIQQMCTLNKVGEALGKIESVHAMTDVTGFGLLGHSIEMAEGSKVSVEIFYDRLQFLPGVNEYIFNRVFPGGTTRNLAGYRNKVKFERGVEELVADKVLADPQTNGGLLIAVGDEGMQALQETFAAHNLQNFCTPIGRIVAKNDYAVTVM